MSFTDFYAKWGTGDWTDYAAEMADEVILQRLLALNVVRST
jgi:hypothetical protein